MQLLADGPLTTSVNDEVHIEAKDRIELRDGHSAIVLAGGDITLTMPGLFSAPMSTHEFMPAGGARPDLPNLPSPENAAHWIELSYRDLAAVPMAGADYTVRFDSGVVIQGRLDASGFARLDGVPYEAYTVKLGESMQPPKPRRERDPNPFVGGGPAATTQDAAQRLQAFGEMELAALQDDHFADEIAAMFGAARDEGGSVQEDVEMYVDDYRTDSPGEQALRYEDYRADHPEGREPRASSRSPRRRATRWPGWTWRSRWSAVCLPWATH